jgi:hypothetical protein
VNNINSHRVWSCGAIGQKLNYYLSPVFGPLHHADVIASYLLFSPLTLTKYKKITPPKLGANLLIGQRGRQLK